jgi:High potential iron-sulfur protein
MSSSTISRREAGKRLFLASATLLVPTWLATACSKKELACTDVSRLTPDESAMRTTLAYLDAATDPSKKCSACQLFKPGQDGQCGACTVLKGPINPNGGCKSFAPKVT